VERYRRSQWRKPRPVRAAAGERAGGRTADVDVDDLAADRKRIVPAGERIHVEEQEVPGMGSLSPFTDPEGRMMGLWRQAANSRG